MKVLKMSFLAPSLVFLLVSCRGGSSKTSAKDAFYKDHGDWDDIRIPFIKPYEAISIGEKTGWSMNLAGKDGDSGIPNIKKATIIDSVILLYSTNTILHGADAKQSWYVIIPRMHVEKGFGSYREYADYLTKLGIKEDQRLHDVDSISSYFGKNDFIDWKEINRL